MKYSIILFVFALILDTDCLSENLNYAPDRILVKLRNVPEAMQKELKYHKGVSATGIGSIDALNQKYGVYAIEQLFENVIQFSDTNRIGRIFVFRLPAYTDISGIVDEYKRDPMVEYAEPDYVGQGGGTAYPNDTLFSEQWALYNTGQTGGKKGADIDAIETWEITTGNKEIIIAILDTGVDLQHPDLKSKIIAGFDFVNSDADPQDDHGHGTSIAGIIGAEANNREGIAGVCWDCIILPVKVLDNFNQGFYSWWEKGIYYAIEQHARIINMSFGGPLLSRSLKDAIEFAYSNGAVLVSITHNFGNNIIYYPGGYENVIAVGATDMNDKRWINSNYGSYIDVVAPGVNILTTTKGGTYSQSTGTSQAAAHVSGLSALLLSLKPDLTPSQLRKIIEQTAEDKIGSESEDTPGWDQYYGYGRINAYKAVALTTGIVPTSVQSKKLSTATTWGSIKERKGLIR